MSPLYDDDLAFVHARGFGELAAAAAAAVIPQLLERRARRVVDIGCGAGVRTEALVAAGFDTLGIEPSGALLDLARRVAPAARFQQASAHHFPFEPCDAMLAFGEVLTYYSPSEGADSLLGEFISRAGRALGPGGLLVFDLIETGDPTLDARAWKVGADWAVLSESREDAQTRRLTREIETFRDVGGGSYRRRSEVHHVRLFERSAVISWLEQAGFEVETASAYGSFALARRRVAFFANRR